VQSESACATCLLSLASVPHDGRIVQRTERIHAELGPGVATTIHHAKGFAIEAYVPAVLADIASTKAFASSVDM